MTDVENCTIEQLAEMCGGDDETLYLPATTQLRKLLSIEESPPIQEVVESHVLPHLVRFMGMEDKPTLVYEAAWAVTNVASGNARQSQAVIDAGAVQVFIHLIDSTNYELCEQAVWGLGNIAGTNSTMRDYIIKMDAIPPIVRLLAKYNTIPMSTLTNTIWTFSNLCRHKPPPNPQFLIPALPTLLPLFSHQFNDVLTDTTWTVCYMSDNSPEMVQALVDSKICEALVGVLDRSDSVPIRNTALHALGNVASGNDAQTQAVINAGIFPVMHKILKVPQLKKSSCWLLSNISGGTKDQTISLYNSGLLKPLLKCLKDDDPNVKKEACWALTNSINCGSQTVAEHLISLNFVSALYDPVFFRDEKLMEQLIPAIDFSMQVGATTVAQQMRENKWVQRLTKLSVHPNSQIREAAGSILGRLGVHQPPAGASLGPHEGDEGEYDEDEEDEDEEDEEDEGDYEDEGDVRFTVLTKQVVRCEYSSAGVGQFVDSATFAFVNRNLATPRFEVTWLGTVLQIETDDVIVVYNSQFAGIFTDDNLQIVVKKMGVTWRPSLPPSGNLLGTIRTLDTVDGATELYCPNMDTAKLSDSHCTLGVISRDGWVLINDTSSPQFDSHSWPWFTSPPINEQTCALPDSTKVDCNPNSIGGQAQCESMGCCFAPGNPGIPECFYPIDQSVFHQDWYFFGHGHEYVQALKDFTLLSAPHPLLPRYTYGPQYSRWYAYNEEDERLLIEQGFVEHEIPLDVLVLDMDWHTSWNHMTTNCLPYFDSWTGFTWNTNLFPDPSRFISWLHKRGVRVTLNNHPNSGVQCIEATYPEMARYWGIDPASRVTVPYVLANKNWSTGFFDIVMDPIQGNGVDYWWVDYQQGERMLAPNVNPTWWVNYVFTTNPSWWSGEERPMLMARWGGLGNHRLGQIGFSGDTQTSWASLAFQPYFTATASNVGGFLWSHDTGGFEGQPDAELFTRWIQWSAFSPTLRVHCNGKDGFNRDIWLYPYDSFKTMREAFQLRASLVPYISSAAYDELSGIGLLRPMYYTHPDNDEAYLVTNQYWFGPSMFVSPIVAKSDENGLAIQKIWVPPGNWVEWYSGKMFTGPKMITRQFSIQEIPIYVSAGTVIPRLDMTKSALLGSAQDVPESLELLVFPGSVGKAVTSYYYDDDGLTTRYVLGEWAKTSVIVKADANILILRVNPYEGKGFPSMPEARTYRLKFRGVWPPAAVRLDNKFVQFDDGGKQKEFLNTWEYDGSTLSVIVNIRTPIPTKTTTEVAMTFAESLQNSLLFTDYTRQLGALQSCKAMFDTLWPQYFPDDYPSLLVAGQLGLNMTVSTTFNDLAGFGALYSQAVTEVSLLPLTDQKTRCLALLAMQ
ncbi:glycoside hydrolase [Pelomyxa schiedti]|nr:glycoside hydrolase [Pelomyxa schiedti]